MANEITIPSTSDERLWAMLAHLLPLIGLSFIAPLVIWLVKKDESPFVSDQAKESLNFQVSIFLAFVVSAILIFVAVGIFLLPLVGFAALIFGIIAAIKSFEGAAYRYPVCIRIF